MSRLRKKQEAYIFNDDGLVNMYDGYLGNFSSFMYTSPMGVCVPDIQDKIENNRITKEMNYPSLGQIYDLEDPLQHPEWMIQDSREPRRLKNKIPSAYLQGKVK